MRRSLGKFSNPTLGNATRHPLIADSSSAFSSSAGGGGGWGRGRGSPFSVPQFTAPTAPGVTEPDNDDPNSKGESPSPFPSGLGRGRGKPFPSTPVLPSFASFTSPGNTNSSGLGRGRTSTLPPPQTEPHPREGQKSGPKVPIFLSKRENVTDLDTPKSQIGLPGRNPQDRNLPDSILSVVLTGAGRGKPQQQQLAPQEKPKEQNRHLRPHQPRKGKSIDFVAPEGSITPRLSREEAVKKAVGILSRGGEDRAAEGGRGRGGYGGRGPRGGRGRWTARGRGGRGGRDQDADDDFGSGLYLGDDADGENLAKRIGVEKMDKLVEGFEEIGGNVLPSPMEDAYLDALETNLMIECEPEYMVEEFGRNPDIDEKPPIPLRDALEKMKPFLMAYENIKSQEEWEEAVKEAMESVPLMKKLVDHYSGPDRVTAKKQQEELERVSKTLPESAPASVKQFTDRALLSLQSNPGWGFDRKCQFMDKLVWEVSRHYK